MNHLVREEAYLLLREKGSSCCGKSRCKTCFNIKETNTFQNFATKKIYKINHHFHCDSKCIIYPQSFGLTADRFCLRWNYYKCFRKVGLEDGTPKQNYFHQYFCSCYCIFNQFSFVFHQQSFINYNKKIVKICIL